MNNTLPSVPSSTFNYQTIITSEPIRPATSTSSSTTSLTSISTQQFTSQQDPGEDDQDPSDSCHYLARVNTMEAPVSSPSVHTHERGQYFETSSSSTQHSYNTRSAMAAQHQQQSAQTQPTQSHAQQQQAQAQAQAQALRHNGSANGTQSFLQDFNLVAEAAKRAQMAVLMRDMEGCGLSSS